MLFPASGLRVNVTLPPYIRFSFVQLGGEIFNMKSTITVPKE